MRNPLLATIAAVALTREPERPLPTSRVDLYKRFYELLTDEEASGRATEAELHGSWASSPSKRRFAIWVHEHWREIVDELAERQVAGAVALSAEAAEWVQGRHPGEHPLPPGWEDVLCHVLLATGLFVRDDEELRFLHHSMAEFIAAKAHAGRIPADFPEIERWITRGLSGVQRTFALFTFVLWSRRPGCSLDLLLRRLLGGSVRHSLLAGRLLAETPTHTQTAEPVIERLIEVAIAQATTADVPLGLQLPEAFDVLAELAGNQQVMWSLRELLDRPELRLLTRILAAYALGRVAGSRQVAADLELLTSDVGPDELWYLAAVLSELFPDDTERARQVLAQIHDRPPQDPATRIVLAERLEEIGEKNWAVDVARSVVLDPNSHGRIVGKACKVWLTAAGLGGRSEVTEALKLRHPDPWDSSAAADVFAEVGDDAAAVELARSVLADPTADGVDLGTAVHAWFLAAGTEATREIIAALDKRPV